MLCTKPNQGFDSFYKCCQDALYLLPTFLLSCLLASEVAKFLQYASVVWLVSTSVADNFLLLFLVLVLAAIL